MNKTVVGIVWAMIGAVTLTEVYKLGYNRGVDDCKRMLTLAVEVSEAVKKKES